jgi:hypothetical protein
LRYWLHLLQAPKYGAGFIAAIDRLYEAPAPRDGLSILAAALQSLTAACRGSIAPRAFGAPQRSGANRELQSLRGAVAGKRYANIWNDRP